MTGTRAILGSALAVLVCAVALAASTPVDLSGKWTFIQAKSRAAAGTSFSNSEVTLDITQKGTAVQMTKTIKNPGGMVDVTTEDYVLDGKERSTTEGPVVTKRTGTWSTDKKTIVLIQTITLGSRVFTTENVHALSDNGKVLTIQSKEVMNAKEGKLLLVYEKQ